MKNPLNPAGQHDWYKNFHSTPAPAPVAPTPSRYDKGMAAAPGIAMQGSNTGTVTRGNRTITTTTNMNSRGLGLGLGLKPKERAQVRADLAAGDTNAAITLAGSRKPNRLAKLGSGTGRRAGIATGLFS